MLLRFSAFNAIRFLVNSTLCVSAVTLYRISIAIYRMSILYIVSLWLSIDFLYFFESFYIEYLLTFIELRGIIMAKY